MKTFTVPTRPYDDHDRLYLRKDVSFKPGQITCLVGCNGSGKSTLMMLLKDQMRNNRKILILEYDDRRQGGSNMMEKFAFYDQLDLVAQAFTSSEGEKIMMGIGGFISGIRRSVRKSKPEEIWIFLDAVGSGLSIDGINEIKDIADVIIEDNKGTDVYFIVSTNEYEFARGEDCVDMNTFKHKRFDNYEEYRSYILSTRERKDKRIRARNEAIMNG